MPAYHQRRCIRHKSRKYTNDQVSVMRRLRSQGMTYEEIGALPEFNVGGDAIANQLYENSPGGTSDQPLRVPDFSGWDFSGENVA
jgi:hypothetical protein